MRLPTALGLCFVLIAASAVVLGQSHLDYNGGPVVSRPTYYIVMWGTGSYDPHVTSTGSPSIATFLQNVGTAFSWLDGEYNTVNSSYNGTKTNQRLVDGTYGGSITITPSTSSSTVSDSTVQSELSAQIAAGHLPAPAQDALGYGITIYIVYFPHGKTITQGGSNSCQAGGFCAYHGTIQPASGGHYFYAVMPDMQPGSGCDMGCGSAATNFGNYTSVLSHELAETITDADVGLAGNGNGPPLAWYDNTNGEIGDICNAQQGFFTGSDSLSYVVQLLWSNAQNKCIGPRGGSPPTNDFSLSANPTSVTIAPGSSGTSTIDSTVFSGNKVTINLSASGLPAGVTASFNPTPVISGNSSILTLSSTAAVMPGSYTVTVTGSDPTGFSPAGASGVTRTATEFPARGNDFSIALGRSSISVSQGSGGSVSLSTAVVDGLPETLSLSVSGLSNGVSASFGPSTLSTGQASTLYLIASNMAYTGTVAVTVTGASASGFHSATFSLTVTPPAGNGGSITNGGFETGDLTGWTASGGFSVVRSNAHSGKYAALVGKTSPTNGDSSLSQTFIPPAGASQLSLSYATHCPDTADHDWATATLRDNTFGLTSVILPKTCNHSEQWSSLTVAITPGHSYTLTLTNHDDAYPGDATYTLYDDVAFSSPSDDAIFTSPGVSSAPVIPAWTQIGAPETPGAPPPAIKRRYHGTPFTSRVTPSDVAVNGFAGLAAIHSVNIALTVTGTATTISIANIPMNAVYGGSFTPTFAYNGNGTTSVTSSTAGTCTVSGGVVSFVGVGTCTLTAHATAGTSSPAVDGSPQSFAIAQATTTISIGNLPANAVYGGSFTPTFAYTGDGTTSVTSGTPGTCTVSGGVVSFVGVGTCTLTAHATAGTNYKTVDGAAQQFTIGQATPTISISNLPANAVYGGSFTPTFAYTGDGATSVTSGTPGACTVSGGVVSFVGVGTCTLTAHATAGTNYKAVDGAAQQFTIGQATPTISIGNLPANAVYGGSFTPTFAYTGDGATSVTSGTPGACTVSGGVVSFVGAGTCTLTAHATAGTNYKAVDGAAQSFAIGQATASISISNLPANAAYGGSFTPTTAYTGDGTTSVTSGTPGACTISGGVVSFVGAGTCTLTAHATAGTNYKAVDGAAQSFTIGKAMPAISWATPAPITYGTALSALQLNATATVPGMFAYTPAAGTVLPAGNQTLSVTFTPSDATKYTTAAATSGISVSKAILTVTAQNVTRPYGTANPALTAQYGGFVNGDPASVVSGAPTLTTTATTASLPGTYPITVGPGTLSATNYGFTLVSGTLTVSAITADGMSALVGQLLAAGLIDNAGIANSLTSKLSGISSMIAKGNTNAAKNQLNAFINELDAQLGKHISQQAYDLLKAAALYLINSLP